MEKIDVVIPIRRTDRIDENLICSIYREIPLNNLIIDDTIGIGLSRQHLLNLVDTKIYVSIDADVPFIPKGWFDNNYNLISKDNKIAIIVSPVIFGENNILYDRSMQLIKHRKYVVSLSCAIINTDIIKSIGGYKNMLSGEDVELHKRVIDRDYKWMVSDIPVNQPRTLIEDFKHLKWWSEEYAKNSRNAKTIIRRLISGYKKGKYMYSISGRIDLMVYEMIRNIVWVVGFTFNYLKHHRKEIKE